jgi:hypothetical protein
LPRAVSRNPERGASKARPVRPGPKAIQARTARRARRGQSGPRALPDRHHRWRILRENCATTTCSVTCNEDEVLVSAYCGPKRNPPNILTERSVSCGVVPSAASSPLVAVCLGAMPPR